MAALRKQMAQLNHVRQRYFREEQALQPGTQRHGRVWLLLRTKQPK